MVPLKAFMDEETGVLYKEKGFYGDRGTGWSMAWKVNFLAWFEAVTTHIKCSALC